MDNFSQADDREFKGDKLNIVDVLAKDAQGRVFQVEVQVLNTSYLANRMLYNWSCLYSKQITKSKNYDALAPVYSIWILASNMLADNAKFHDIFAIHSSLDGDLLTDHLEIHVLELSKWAESDQMNPLGQWLCFFKGSSQWVSLPDKLSRNVMRQAMKVLEDIADKEDNYYRYLKIQDRMLDQATLEKQRAEAKAFAEQEKVRAEAEKDRADAEKNRADAEKDRADAQMYRAEREQLKAQEQEAKAKKAESEVERLRKIMLDQGIDPDKA